MIFMKFEAFPHTQELIEKLKLQDYVDTMKWHYFVPGEIDEKLQEVYDTFQQLTSSNIPQLLAAKERVNEEYITIGSKIHVFAREEARHQLGLTNEDVTKIFSAVEIGGTRHLI